MVAWWATGAAAATGAIVCGAGAIIYMIKELVPPPLLKKLEELVKNFKMPEKPKLPEAPKAPKIPGMPDKMEPDGSGGDPGGFVCPPCLGLGV